jgi:spore maturation protein CgeB
MLLENPEMRARFGGAGIDAIATRHSCAHRVDELMSICQELRSAQRETVVATGIQTG